MIAKWKSKNITRIAIAISFGFKNMRSLNFVLAGLPVLFSFLAYIRKTNGSLKLCNLYNYFSCIFKFSYDF